jgi:serine/threonine-protein kinase RsbW
MTEFAGPVVLSVSSRFENIEVVNLVCEQICSQCRFDGEQTYQIALALREGVANAIKHGNRQAPGKLVEIRFENAAGSLRIEIEDQGAGFDPARVPDPLASENLLKTSGRGILYINNLMDRHEYRFEPGRGTVLLMEKRIAPAA